MWIAVIKCCIINLLEQNKLQRSGIDKSLPQNEVNALVEWTQRWLLTLNIKKCLIVFFLLTELSIYGTDNSVVHAESTNILKQDWINFG